MRRLQQVAYLVIVDLQELALHLRAPEMRGFRSFLTQPCQPCCETRPSVSIGAAAACLIATGQPPRMPCDNMEELKS